MKILHIASTYKGGSGTAALRLNSNLRNRGINSTIFARSKSNFDNLHLLKINTGLTGDITSKIFTYSQSKFVQKNTDLFTPFTLDFTKNNATYIADCDVLHFHSTYNGINFLGREFLKGKLKNKPIVITLHDQRFFTAGCHYSKECHKYTEICVKCPQSKAVFQNKIKNQFVRNSQILNSFKKLEIISPSEWLSKLAKQSSMLGKFPIHTIPNIVENEQNYNEFSYNFAVTKNHKTEKRQLIIGFIAADLSNPLKGFSDFKKALKILQNSNLGPIIRAKVAGSGVPKIESEELPIEYLGKITTEQQASFYNDIDILIVPSSEDNSPNVIGEALIRGTPVLASDVGGISEILKYHDLPTYRPNAPDEIAKTIVNYAIKLSSANSDSIRILASNYFNIDNICNDTIDVYNSLLA